MFYSTDDMPEPVPVEGLGDDETLEMCRRTQQQRRWIEAARARTKARRVVVEYRVVSGVHAAKLRRKLAQLEVLAARGATEGEREAARRGAERVREHLRAVS